MRRLFRPRPMNATTTERPWQPWSVGLGLSAAAHALLLLLAPPTVEKEPEAKVLEVAFIQQGDPTKPLGPPQGVETPAPEVAVRESPQRPPTLPQPAPAAPVAPTGDRPLPSPVPAPPGPTSFRDWQRSQQRSAFMPKGVPNGTGGGVADGGPTTINTRGRDRCQPRPGRRFEVLYLLFDSSGSMTSTGRAQALACVHQYVQSALATQATVVVGNFARGTTWTGPTTSMFDVEAALRGGSDGRATILPSRELQPFLDQAPGAASELVIVSDGMFLTTPEILIWYRYFLELNHENRGTMYTVGSTGYRPSVTQLRQIGFDVFIYDQIQGIAHPN